MVRAKWYTGKMVLDKMVCGQSGTDKLVLDKMVYEQNGLDKMIYEQNGIRQHGTDKMVTTFCIDFNSIEYNLY